MSGGGGCSSADTGLFFGSLFNSVEIKLLGIFSIVLLLWLTRCGMYDLKTLSLSFAFLDVQ